MGTRIRPLNDKLVIKRLEAEEKTKGGIVLPDTAKEKPREGRVIAVGDGKLLDSGKRAAVQVKKDDRVIFSSYAGTEIKINGEDLLILDESDVLAIVEVDVYKRQLEGLAQLPGLGGVEDPHVDEDLADGPVGGVPLLALDGLLDHVRREEPPAHGQAHERELVARDHAPYSPRRRPSFTWATSRAMRRASTTGRTFDPRAWVQRTGTSAMRSPRRRAMTRTSTSKAVTMGPEMTGASGP